MPTTCFAATNSRTSDLRSRVAIPAGALGPEIFRLAVDDCPTGMIVVGGDGAIRLVNREIERLFGYDLNELSGKTIDILLPEKLRSGHAAYRAGYAERPGNRHFGTGRDFNGRRKDGSEFPIEVGLSPIRVGGEMIVICAVVDLSLRKRLERFQDELVGTVSHELRTPMTSIIASLGLLLAGSADNLPQPAAHLLRIVHSSCLRLMRIVNDLLDLKKLEAGHMPFHFERCDARALLEQAVEANQSLAASCGVTIRLEVPPNATLLDVDLDRFNQIISNLLSNALKFSPGGTYVMVTLEKNFSKIRVAVRDHGNGIPAEFKPRVFQPFAQGAGTKRSGSGLGLSITQRIVEGMHGQISFEDAPGGGTVFYVDLPNADHPVRGQVHAI